MMVRRWGLLVRRGPGPGATAGGATAGASAIASPGSVEGSASAATARTDIGAPRLDGAGQRPARRAAEERAVQEQNQGDAVDEDTTALPRRGNVHRGSGRSRGGACRGVIQHRQLALARQRTSSAHER
jgi:hypothetical protein